MDRQLLKILRVVDVIKDMIRHLTIKVSCMVVVVGNQLLQAIQFAEEDVFNDKLLLTLDYLSLYEKNICLSVVDFFIWL